MKRTQEELDRIVRAAAGKNAVEKMTLDTAVRQVYQLSNGTFLTIYKVTGETQLRRASGEVIG